MSTERAREAFQRLLADAAGGGQAKVDALVALAQRTILVGLWGPGQDGFRTLLNSNGQSALPVFSEAAELEEAATRFAWRQPDGSVAHKEVGAREALRYAVAHNVQYVVIDICSAHALEAERGEIEPLLTATARRESQGPNAAVGRISSSMIQAQRPTPAPGSLTAGARPTPPPGSVQPGKRPTPPPGSVQPGKRPTPAPGAVQPGSPVQVPVVTSAAPPAPGPAIVASTGASPGGKPAATFGSGSSVKITKLASAPSDDLLDALASVLRGYPEVEWGALCNVARGPAAASPSVGLRVETSFRSRVNEIIAGLRRAGEQQGASLDVLLLDDAALMRAARAEGLAFFPWKKR